MQQNIIELKNLIKTYDKVVLKDININFQKGERIALVGANGSGKTTLSEIIADIRKPSKGKVLKNKKVAVGIQFQDTRFPFGITVMDMIKYYLKSFNIEMNAKELYDLLITYQIDDFKNKFISDLSGGQQQRLNILLAMIHKPDVIILDEVSTGLDIQVREEIFQFIKKEILNQDITIILVTHMMDEVERFCHRLIFLHEGIIVEDEKVAILMQKHQSIQKYVEKKLTDFKIISEQKQSDSIKYQKNAKLFNKKNQFNNKSFGLTSLIMKYFGRNKVIPFFIIFYPIISLFLLGRAVQFLYPEATDAEKLQYVQTLVAGVSIVQIAGIGIFVMPEMIIEFKKSILMKRIGATGIRPIIFNVTIIGIGFALTLFSFLWSTLWSGILFGSQLGWNEVLLFDNVAKGLPFLILLLISSTGFGLMLAAFFKTSSAFLGAANLIYIIVAVLSGGFVPITIMEKSAVLNALMYINPFHYATALYWDILLERFEFGWRFFTFVPISLLLIVSYSIVGIKNLKWQK